MGKRLRSPKWFPSLETSLTLHTQISFSATAVRLDYEKKFALNSREDKAKIKVMKLLVDE